MKIKYHILLFEDNYSSLGNFKGYLEGILYEQGFELDLSVIGENFHDEIIAISDKLQNYNPYDLIICDYDLGSEEENGISIAERLRRGVYTDIVFYSGAKPDGLWESICERKVQGVYVINRFQISDELGPIIDDHLRKITDLNNMRGFVMDAFSSIDKMVREIAIEKSDDHEVSSLKLKKKIEDKHKDLIRKHYSDGSASTLVDRLDPVNCEFDLARRVLKNLLEDRGEKAELHNLIENEIKAVQRQRNQLAHAKSEPLPCGSLKLGEKTYNHDEFIELRKEIVKILADLKRLARTETS
tara:strand:+ start:6782 stop:7678 length:897 start_codon:yes stop_codon:yes gene_type:complete